MRTRLLIGVALVGWGVWPADCFAQLPITQPPVNPRINLANRNFNPAIAYYGLVRPQIDTRFALQQIQQEAAKNQETIAAELAISGPLPTGHASQFMTQSLYFQTTALPVGAIRPPPPGTPGTPAVRPVRTIGSRVASSVNR